jgi:hypothetical protein
MSGILVRIGNLKEEESLRLKASGVLQMEENAEENSEHEFLPAPHSWFDEAVSTETLDEQESESTTAVAERGTAAASDSPKQELMDPPVISLMSSCADAVGTPLPSPSWREISSQVLPAAARELLSSSLRRILHTAQISYSKGRWHRKYSDLGNNTGGYYRSSGAVAGGAGTLQAIELPAHLPELPPFSCLPWIDRQLVREWRTYLPDDTPESEEEAFDRARALVPMPIAPPSWEKYEVCHQCRKTFGPTRLRHHCRLCGCSFCQPHSENTHALPHLGYDPDVPERVCDSCKALLTEQNLAERVAWRLARCRDLKERQLTPYFETGIDTLEDAAIRITNAALSMAKSIPLGAQASVAVETVDTLRKHGLNGIMAVVST